MHLFTRFIASFFCIIFINGLSAQCPPVWNCPAQLQTINDQSNNDPTLWNATYWWDKKTAMHDLADAAVDLSLLLSDTCNAGPYTASCILSLDLDGDGLRETFVSSEYFSDLQAGALYYNNGFQNIWNAGELRNFQASGNASRFFLLDSLKGNQQFFHLRWQNAQNGALTLPQLPYGQHAIYWAIQDANGKEYTCTYEFVVRDGKAPTVGCLNSGLFVNLPASGKLEILVDEFLLYAEDNYCPALEYAARRVGTGSGFPSDSAGNYLHFINFDCADLGKTIAVELWAKDEAGNTAFCTSEILIADPAGACKGSSNRVVTSCASVCNSTQGIEDVNWAVYAFNNGVPEPLPFYTSTPCLTYYVDSPLIQALKIVPFNDDNHINGVSSFDIVLLQKHILNSQLITGVCSKIAADVNQDGRITTLDAIDMRKVVLGVYTEFPSTLSWRFIPADHVFPPPPNPYDPPKFIPEGAIYIDTLPTGPIYQNFKAIKMGDINGNAVPNGLLPTLHPEDRSGNAMELLLQDALLSPGETLEIPVLPGANTLHGLQFSLKSLDPGLHIEAILPGNIEALDAENIYQQNNDCWALSWARGHAAPLNPAETFCRLRLRASAPVRLSDALQLGSLRAEAYDANLQTHALALRFLPAFEKYESVGIGQVYPNPGTGDVYLPLQSADKQMLEIQCFDLDGKMIYRRAFESASAAELIVLPAAIFRKSGLYTWRLSGAGLVKSGLLVRE
ncbi:MAG: hypothetical protein J0L99_15560 [Chitinophagales bacterium]|nr:hypothetical protein [Chitinophagales bacterium]